MRIYGIICLLFVVMNLHACSKGDIRPPQVATPLALILGIVFLMCGNKSEEYEKDPSAYERDKEADRLKGKR